MGFNIPIEIIINTIITGIVGYLVKMALDKVKEYQGHDEKEVKAYYNAINYMERCLDNDTPISESFIQKIVDIFNKN